MVVQHRAEFFDEIVDVFKFAIDRRESDEGDLVDLPQQIEDFLADVSSRDFVLEIVVNVGFNFVDQRLDVFLTDWSLVTCFFKSGSNLLFVERDSRAVLLDDFDQGLLDLFVGREAAFALHALAAPPDDGRFAGA